MLFRVLGDRRLRLAVLLVLLAALAHQVSLVVWQLLPMPPQSAMTPANQIVRNAAGNNSGVNFQQQAAAIGRAFLFGKAEARVEQVVVEEVVETKLNYKLRGIYYSPDEMLSSAIVEVKPNKSQHYMLDDELDENITLAKIELDHIVLNRYGKLERLNLQKRDGQGRQSLTTAASGGGATQTALLRSYKRRYSSNPMALATRFQAIPVQQDGKNVGFKLKALRGESLLKKLNFEPNDVFTAVNGVELKNPFEALDALKSLTTATSVSVTFMRNGAEQTLDFQI
jgi:general secretion pathway protein C